jgi:hypothetical protein
MLIFFQRYPNRYVVRSIMPWLPNSSLIIKQVTPRDPSFTSTSAKDMPSTLSVDVVF